HLFTKSQDWLAFVPTELNFFTTVELATGIEANRELAQKLAYCLRHAKMIELIGRRGRANLYRVADATRGGAADRAGADGKPEAFRKESGKAASEVGLHLS